jgi:hypothetical protein
LLDFPYLPLTVSPFVDVGEAWTHAQGPVLSFNANAEGRSLVASAGISARFNLLGYAIIEIYGARPFQRPGKSWVYGVQLAPGW